MSETPVWFLDVDGVVNDWRSHLPVKPGWKRWNADGWTITQDTSVVTRIVDMHVSGRVRVIWLTTWLDRANAHIRERMGFPADLEVAGVEDYHRAVNFVWWKLPAVVAFVEKNPDTPIIWADDDLVDSDATAFVREHPDVLGITPKYHLTNEHLDEIEMWLEDRNA